MAPTKKKRLAGQKVAAVACFDSFAKTAMTLLSACRQEGAEVALHLLEIPNRAMSRRQRIEIRRVDPRIPILKGSWTHFRKIAGPMAGEVDVLILGLDGQRSRDALLQLKSHWTPDGARPLLVSAYPGILFRFALEGMLDRSGVDLLCLNSPQDLETYQQGCAALGMDSGNAVVTGLPILWHIETGRKKPEAPSIVFFEQPSIPVHPLQRRFICRQLKDLALSRPETAVIFKPRTSSIESTLHRRHGEMAGVINRMAESVPNLELSFKPAVRLLRHCGCAITVSSTAALEAMAMGVSTRILADLGVTETLGNHFFARSGALATFDAIQQDPFTPTHDVSWLQRNGMQPDGRECFLNAVLDRLQRGAPPLSLKDESIGPAAWGSPAWQTFAIRQGGRRMLSSGGARSSQLKRHQTRSLLRRIRDGLVGFGWLSKLLRER